MTLTSDSDRRTPRRCAEELFEQHRDLASSIARRYATTPHAADIGQVADIALWSAATRFDPARGAFEGFAAVTISGEIKKFLRCAGWAVRVGRRRQEDALRLRQVADDLTVRLARTPDRSDLADATGWTIGRVDDAIRCSAARFSEPASHHLGMDVVDVAESFESMIELLPDLERSIVRMTYVGGLTQREIGEHLAISQTMVHRRLRRAHRLLAVSLAT
ncbi:MAG: sigma-70 family RNA polymerase sigma factor [Ilumatobacteraceae bacterium]|nr:sigma-70 family RNA polymerase sigma factor [Ilumatobacteraceae bacterium]